MNKILVKSVQETLDEINETFECQINLKIHLILQGLFKNDPKIIYTNLENDDMELTFHSLSIKSSITREEEISENSVGGVRIIDKVEILYLEEQGDYYRLNFLPNNHLMEKIMFSTRNKYTDNSYYQRNLLKMIATMLYIKDKQLRGYLWLPQFEDEIRDFIEYYAIYPQKLESLK